MTALLALGAAVRRKAPALYFAEPSARGMQVGYHQAKHSPRALTRHAGPSHLLVTPIKPDVTTATDTASAFDYEQALQRCAKGDRIALESIYRQECRHLLGVALRIVRQRQQAEDVLHDAFMNIWTKAATFNAALGSGRGWIYSLTRNLALNSVRNGTREVSVDEETAEALDAEASMASHCPLIDVFELQASMGRLNDCLLLLEPARRNCILYAYVDGCSHREIAERTQTPLGTVKAWIKRGMSSLRECMT